MKRGCWILFGAAVQVLFFGTVYQLFAFFYAGGGDLLGIEPLSGSLAATWQDRALETVTMRVGVDLVLLLQFGVAHSLFLYPAVRRHIERLLPAALYGSFYAMVASVTLLITFAFWQPLPGILYQTQGILAWMLLAFFLACWGALIYSLSLTGLGFQTGLTPWWAYATAREIPRRAFVTTGAYRFLRHPIYLSFLGLVWFTPRMTMDHFLMAAVWSMYIYLGSVLKDRRLLFFLGDRYRTYMAQVPGYPFILWGPLGRVK